MNCQNGKGNNHGEITQLRGPKHFSTFADIPIYRFSIKTVRFG